MIQVAVPTGTAHWRAHWYKTRVPTKFPPQGARCNLPLFKKRLKFTGVGPEASS